MDVAQTAGRVEAKKVGKEAVEEVAEETAEQAAKQGDEVAQAASSGGNNGGKFKGKGKGPCDHLRQGNGKGPYRGGAHSKTSKPLNDGKDSHHMPADGECLNFCV